MTKLPFQTLDAVATLRLTTIDTGAAEAAVARQAQLLTSRKSIIPSGICSMSHALVPATTFL